MELGADEARTQRLRLHPDPGALQRGRQCLAHRDDERLRRAVGGAAAGDQTGGGRDVDDAAVTTRDHARQGGMGQ